MAKKKRKCQTPILNKGLKFLEPSQYSNVSNKELADQAGLTERQFVNLRARVKVLEDSIMKSDGYMRQLHKRRCARMRAALAKKGINPKGHDDPWYVMLKNWDDSEDIRVVTLEHEDQLKNLRRAIEKDKKRRARLGIPYHFSRVKVDTLTYEIIINYFDDEYFGDTEISCGDCE